MGVSTDAILVYGIDLGSEESLDLDWLDLDDEDQGTGEKFEDKLLKASGFAEEWHEGIESEYYTRKRLAYKELGLGVIYHCSYDYPMVILGIPDSEFNASRGHPVTIYRNDPALNVGDGWDEKIKWGLEVLGITPKTEPSWLLASMWG